MNDILSLVEQIEKALKSLRDDFKALNLKGTWNQSKTITLTENKLNQIQILLEVYVTEISLLDKKSKAQHKDNLNQFKDQVKELLSQFEKRQKEKTNILVDNTDEGLFNKDTHDMTGQKAAQDILTKVLSMNENADNINKKLKIREEKIASCEKATKEVQTELKKSNKILRYFMKDILKIKYS